MKTFPARTLLCALFALATACTAGGDQDGGVDAAVQGDGALDAAPPQDAQVTCEADVRLGEACTSTAECSDGCFCNGVERCMEGVCVAGDAPCDDGVECTVDVCDEAGRSCSFEPDHTVCADDDVCNGEEQCVPFAGCRPGLRLRCADDDACTVGSCDPQGGCSFELRDLDGDGYGDHRCGGDDCYDDPVDGASVYPGAPEICGNGRDDNCNGLIDYREPTCLGENDDCDTAEVLPGAGIYVRTTRGLDADGPLGCRAVGPDAYFRFTLTSAQDVQAQLSPDVGVASVAIRRADNCGAGPDAYCGNEAVLARNLQPGEYVAIVKTSTPTSFVLSLSFLDATPLVPVDVCDDDTHAITASGTYTGFFTDVNDDYQLPCRGTSSTAYPDAAYRLVLTEMSDVTLSARTTATSSTTTYLSLLRDCTNPDSSLGCMQGGEPEIRRLSLPAGTYFVLLESSRTNASTWTLTADIQPAMPRNVADSCTTAADITDTTVTVPISTLTFDSGTSCGGTTTSSRDANFFFTLTDTQDVVLTTEAGGIHYVSMASTCGDRTTETFCTSGTPRVERRFLRLPAGTYHVTVAMSLGAGNLTASAQILPPTFPPDNDTCAAPADLSDGVPFDGDLLAAGDAVSSCAPSGTPDALHRLVLTERKNVTAVARRTDGTTEPIYLGLRTACDGVSSDLVCTSGTPALFNHTLDPGTYHFVVESAASFVGPYSLTVYLADP